MKLKITTLIAAMALLITPAVMNAQLPTGGPGIAVAGSMDPSQLPEKAQSFLRNYYPQQQAAYCQRDYGDNEYNLTMNDGTEVTFNSEGKVVDLEAPMGQIIPANVLKAILPEKTYNHLNSYGYLALVDEVDYSRQGVKVSLRTDAPDDIKYDVTGELIEIDY